MSTKASKLTNAIKSKFRGSLFGSLIGECLGRPFRGDKSSPGMKVLTHQFFNKLESSSINIPKKPYSEGIALSMAVARSLIERPVGDFKYMARLFVESYSENPDREYGENMVDIFDHLKCEKNIYKPATQIFEGEGSFGNRGAKRITPIALYFHKNFPKMVEATKRTTKITHAHCMAVNGAILQCLAIYKCLISSPDKKLNFCNFIDDLVYTMDILGIEEPVNEKINLTPYQMQLFVMKRLLTLDSPTDPIDIKEIIEILGNNSESLHSIPTAIYCFLKAEMDPSATSDAIKFRNAIVHAVNLGGETDGIASMTGAIAGAYHGDSIINKHLLYHCEGARKISEIADNLYLSSLSLS